MKPSGVILNKIILRKWLVVTIGLGKPIFNTMKNAEIVFRWDDPDILVRNEMLDYSVLKFYFSITSWVSELKFKNFFAFTDQVSSSINSSSKRQSRKSSDARKSKYLCCSKLVVTFIDRWDVIKLERKEQYFLIIAIWDVICWEQSLLLNNARKFP